MSPKDKPEQSPYPQQGRERMIFPTPIDILAFGVQDPHDEMLAKMSPSHVFMMGDNPALPRMPEKPTLIDFFNLRFNKMAQYHLTTSAKRAYDEGRNEIVIMACLLHDIANGALLRADHGYWGAQLIAPYVNEEIAWAVKYHQALRYTPDPVVGYEYPEAYKKFFGEDYDPPTYIKRDAAYAMQHKWYMTARYVTLYDLYFFEESDVVPIEFFSDIISRNFRQPDEGLGFDDSPSSHMWRTMIWPNNFL
jgi:hypothetical protein